MPIRGDALPDGPLTTGSSGHELLTQVHTAIEYLRSKKPQPVPFESLISYLSLPGPAQGNIPLIKRALRSHDRAEYIPQSQAYGGKDAFKYHPRYPITNRDELLAYLSRLHSAEGVEIVDLKDGWPDCVPTIDRLEAQGFVLLLRDQRSRAPQRIWPDNPTWHVLDPCSDDIESCVRTVDRDFIDAWQQICLPARDDELQQELKQAGIAPTSVPKQMPKIRTKQQKRKRNNVLTNIATNSHMRGILKEYSE